MQSGPSSASAIASAITASRATLLDLDHRVPAQTLFAHPRRRSPARASSRAAPPARSSAPATQPSSIRRRIGVAVPVEVAPLVRAGVGVRVEVHDRRPCGARRCARRSRRRSGYVMEWSPPSTMGTAPALGDPEDLLVDHAERALEPRRHDGRVARVDHLQRWRRAPCPAGSTRRTRGPRRWAPCGSRAVRTGRPAARRHPRPRALPRWRRRPRRRARLSSSVAQGSFSNEPCQSE